MDLKALLLMAMKKTQGKSEQQSPGEEASECTDIDSDDESTKTYENSERAEKDEDKENKNKMKSRSTKRRKQQPLKCRNRNPKKKGKSKSNGKSKRKNQEECPIGGKSFDVSFCLFCTSLRVGTNDLLSIFIVFPQMFACIHCSSATQAQLQMY